MPIESILTLVPALATVGVAIAVGYMGVKALSCTVARMQGRQCPSI